MLDQNETLLRPRKNYELFAPERCRLRAEEEDRTVIHGVGGAGKGGGRTGAGGGKGKTVWLWVMGVLIVCLLGGCVFLGWKWYNSRLSIPPSGQSGVPPLRERLEDPEDVPRPCYVPASLRGK